MKELDQLIGKVALVEGKQLRVVEVLVSEKTVILEDVGAQTELQENQFGNIQRRDHKRYSVPFYSEINQEKWHPILELFI